MLILITYDKRSKGKDYSPLYDEIKKCGDHWWHYMESVWLVHTNLTPEECNNRLRGRIDKDDYLFVVEITNQRRQGWLPTKAWEWIKTYNN